MQPRFQHLGKSLTFRLSFLFALSASLLLMGTGLFLYFFLERDLMQHDHEEIIGKVELFRHLLTELKEPQQITRAPDVFHNVIIGHPHLYLQLLDNSGKRLLTTTDWIPPAPLLDHPVESENVPVEKNIMMPKPEQPYHAIAAWGKIGINGNNKVMIVLKLDTSEAQDLLTHYETLLQLTLFFSSLLAALTGYFIVRRGLRPLRNMADTASEITAQQLQKRLNVSDAPAELKELASAFNGMLQRLNESFVKLSDFSSDLAHELRTPINNLMGQTQVALSRTRNCEEYRTVLESNLEEYERLARMIRDMLFLAQTDNMQEPAQPVLLSLHEEIDKIAEFFQLAADERSVTIINQTAGSIHADRILLQRAIGNLISNALQHCDRNSQVIITTRVLDEWMEINVRNSGPPIPAEQLKRIFDRFYRVSPAPADSGTGLGLAIVQSIMQLHGGLVKVISTPEQGTNFTLRFPPHRASNMSGLITAKK